jgi:hypothetical protein
MFPATLGAAPVACTGAVGAMLTPSSGCQTGTTADAEALTTLQLNDDGLFGFDDWRAIDDPSVALRLGLPLGRGAFSGTWSIQDVWKILGARHLMVVLESQFTSTFVAYLIDSGVSALTYGSPLSDWNGDSREIMHISVYYRKGVRDVPEPHLLLLFGLGLLVASRRLAASRPHR